ncbi:MAG: cytochrome c biogenesis protein DipZ [Patescibacteria group bacterium]
MTLLLTFAFISGLITIFAPCIWPLLPIILSSSTTGGHKKPFGITLGIMLSFGLLTLTISYIVRIIPFDPEILRYFAVFVIAVLGLTLIIPKLSQILEGSVSKLSSRFSFVGQTNHPGFWSGFITGLALGIVWTPCAGPILATIAALSATQSVNLNVILITLVYIIGVGIPLFIFAWLGKYIFARSRVLSKYTGRVQQVFGVVMIITAILIATNYDKVLQAKLLDFFPSYSNFIVNLESSNGVREQLDLLKNNKSTLPTDTKGLLNVNIKAPEVVGINNWLNTEKEIKIADLKGKVVLVDFWTYTCINCIRTFPHVTSWYKKYQDQGFVVLGIHTPEFEFEKDTKNVENAIKQYKINYPVGQDNNYATWNNYSNRYWPAKYLIDANGNIRKFHFGEGEYEEMEMAIQLLLKEAGKSVEVKVDNMEDNTSSLRISPETYLGSKRMQYYYPSGSLGVGSKDFTLSPVISQNSFSLGGFWEIKEENAVTIKDSVLTYNFSANKVFLVLRPGDSKTSKVKVYLDGELVNNANSGSDVVKGELTIDTDRLYNLIDLKGKSGSHILRLDFEDTGIEVFAFTFG